MESDLDLIDGLNAIDYSGKCVQNDVLTLALEGGTRCAEFREVVGWLANELHVLRKTDEHVSTEVEDPNEFAMELSALLKELGCPYVQLVAGPLSDRFGTREARVRLLEYLITELMATKMSLRLRPVEKTYVIAKTETSTARILEQISRKLDLSKPPENIKPKAFFDKLNFKLEERIRQAKPGIVSEPLLRTEKPLTDEQWKELEAIQADLDAEYNMRRQVLLTRLEVTIQSFQWSDSMRKRENEIVARFQQKMQELEALKHGGDDTSICALLAARADLAIIEKTSSANVRKNTGSKIQKHVIGSVPDRGGRAYEHAPPPPEMPSWQQQRSSGPSGGFGNRGGGGGGGGGGNFRGGRGGGGGQGRGGFGAGSAVPQAQQRMPFEQGRDQNWVTGSGRVQGAGWSQKGNDHGTQRSYDSFERGFNQGSGGARGGGFDHPYRGRSNYNRGGSGGSRR